MKSRILASVVSLFVASMLGIAASGRQSATPQPVLGARSVGVLSVDGLRFRDLNKNGRLDPYEDWRKPVDARVDDLLKQMTIEEKAGLMVSPTLNAGPNGTVNEEQRVTRSPFGGEAWTLPGTSEAVLRLHIRQFIDRENLPARVMATWLNGVQEIAETSRLGIPAFFVTNPRNHVGSDRRVGIDEAAGNFSQWPGTLGLAATRDAALVEEFSRIAAKEYLSVGLRGAYHPQVDLSTEPRWGRISGTLGEDAELSSVMTRAMVRGFQGTALGPASVALIVKHFPGGGAAEGGHDSHFAYGKFMVYPGNNLDYQLRPFKAAIDQGVAAVMPYYSIPKGITKEPLANAFNREIITDLLRGRLGFRGVVNSDSGITTSMVWGVEDLTVEQRYKKAIDAGTDIFSNDATPQYVVNLVKKGELTEARIDESVRRLLRVRFALGIFENPYADPNIAERTVRSAEFERKAGIAQRKSIVLLANGKGALPLKAGTKVYVEGVAPAAVTAHGLIVAATPQEADACLLRAIRGGAGQAQGRGGRGGAGGLGGLATGGQPIDLTLPREQLDKLRSVMQVKPTVVALYLDKPYVVPELARESAALIGHFGVDDDALLDVVTGAFPPLGKLPFEMPSSMDAVRQQKEDVPYDSKDPLFRFGHGLTYNSAKR